MKIEDVIIGLSVVAVVVFLYKKNQAAAAQTSSGGVVNWIENQFQNFEG